MYSFLIQFFHWGNLPFNFTRLWLNMIWNAQYLWNLLLFFPEVVPFDPWFDFVSLDLWWFVGRVCKEFNDETKTSTGQEYDEQNDRSKRVVQSQNIDGQNLDFFPHHFSLPFIDCVANSANFSLEMFWKNQWLKIW